jgi:hypothetical protein
MARRCQHPRTANVYRGTIFFAIPEGASTVIGGKAEFAALPGSGEICMAMITAQSHQYVFSMDEKIQTLLTKIARLVTSHRIKSLTHTQA